MDGTPEENDLREHPRSPIELKVEYKRLNTFFSDYTKNISKGGTFIKTNKPLDIGTSFVFKLFVPKVEEPIKLHGKVQWVITEEDVAAGKEGAEESGMGIRFEYRDTSQRGEIERQVEKLMVDSLGQRLYNKLMEHSRTGDGGDEG